MGTTQYWTLILNPILSPILSPNIKPNIEPNNIAPNIPDLILLFCVLCVHFDTFYGLKLTHGVLKALNL